MPDEQEEPQPPTDSNGDEREEERSLEELGDELLARLDEIDAALAALRAEHDTTRGDVNAHHERISAIEERAGGYASAEHEHPGHEHPYAGIEHEHPHEHAPVQPEPGGAAEKGVSRKNESAPRSDHWWYRPIKR